jgi:single-stranded DNA-binding protein
MTMSSTGHPIQVIGNIGAEPKWANSERCNFSVAVYAGKDKNTDEKMTKWFNVTAWDEMANEMREFHKGDRVKVAGQLSFWFKDDGTEQLSITLKHIEPSAFQGKKATAKKPTSAAKKVREETKVDLGGNLPF